MSMQQEGFREALHSNIVQAVQANLSFSDTFEGENDSSTPGVQSS